MALFEEKHFSKPISEKLSSYLREHTTKHDRADVSERTGVGASTIRDVAYRSSALSKRNSEAIIELMRIAIKNCERSKAESIKAGRELTEMLQRD